MSLSTGEKIEETKKNEFILISEIIKLSVSKNWDDAKKEWDIYDIKDIPNQTCLCSHFPIKENVFIYNKNNQNKTVVGNCCINKFFEDKSLNKLFKAIKESRLNQGLIDFAFKKNIINNWELKFLKDVWRIRKKSPKQNSLYESLRDKIIFNLKNG